MASFGSLPNLSIEELIDRFFATYPHYRPTSPPISSDDEYEPPSDYDTDEDEDL